MVHSLLSFVLPQVSQKLTRELFFLNMSMLYFLCLTMEINELKLTLTLISIMINTLSVMFVWFRCWSHFT